MEKLFELLPVSKKMPVIFTSHGNSMDIIDLEFIP